MTIVNRRNALIGWAMLKLWKRNARRKTERARSRLAASRRKSS
jgi:hypothetical protein